MAKFRMTAHVEYENGTPAVGLPVSAHEVFTNNDYDLGVTDSQGIATGDLREIRKVSVPDSPLCFWSGCPHHDEDDHLDRPGVTLTVTAPSGNSFTTLPFSTHMFDHAHVILPAWFSSSLTLATPVGHFGRRKNISDPNDFTDAERRELADLIFGYLDDALIDTHMNEVDHIDNLFTDHRSYLYEIEKKLLRDGHAKYVPLPIWEPLDNIPDRWQRVKSLHGRSLLPLLPYNLSPISARPQLPTRLRPERIGVENFPTAQSVALEIGRSAWSSPGSYHFNAHAVLGGPFLSMGTAAAALMFWAFHPVLVEVYDQWMIHRFGGGTAIRLGLNVDGDGKGRMELFRIGLDHRLWHSYQRRKCRMRDDMDMDMGEGDVTFDHWSHWEHVGDAKDLASFEVITDAGGMLVVLAKGTDNKSYVMRNGPSGWTSWTDLAAEVFDLAGSRNPDGTLEIVATRKVGTTFLIATATETTPGNTAFPTWTSRTGPVGPGTVETARDAQGLPHVFYRGGDGKLNHLWKKADGTWGGPEAFTADPVRIFRAVQNQDGRLEVFILRAQDDGVHHRWVNATSPPADWAAAGTWSPWERFGTLQANHFAVGSNSDGRLEVFAADVGGKVRHIWQMAVNSGWSTWSEIPRPSLMGRVGQVIGTVADHTGRLKVFVQGSDDFVYMAEQSAPNQGPWIGWTNL